MLLMQFHDFLCYHDFIDDIYKAMEDPDLAEPVITVLNILKKTNNIPPHTKETKSESISTTCRTVGNKAYASKQYQQALICYNKALLYAPKNSREMKLAYSNRSALHLQMKYFSASLNDIETCFSMGCPLDLIEKLRKRKDEVKEMLWMEKFAEDLKMSDFSNEYFQLNVRRNPQIPCASSVVDVIVERDTPKIIVNTDVKVGTVLAIETAFVSQNDRENDTFSCYYCHNMNLNLKPCDGCCSALFCNDKCRQSCLNQYHDIECKIINDIEGIMSNVKCRLAFKAFLKMKYESKSWKELISASHSLGTVRLKSSSINEIYDSNNKFCLLNNKDERHFLNGPLYNFSFICAWTINALDAVPGFFPQNEKYSAVRAAARILMFLTLYCNCSQIVPCATVNENEIDRQALYEVANYGCFAFLGKLKNSCIPNVLAVALNKSVALVTVAPIKKGTELTVSYCGHWLDNLCDKESRNKNMFQLYGFVCNCIICTEEYKVIDKQLTEAQKKHLRKLNLDQLVTRLSPQNMSEIFQKLSQIVAFLSDSPFTEEYYQVFRVFRKGVLHLQNLKIKNRIYK